MSNTDRDFGLTREQLNKEFDQLSNESGLTEDFTDGELWPTAGLSDRQIELLTERLVKVKKADKKSRFLGKLGLRP